MRTFKTFAIYAAAFICLDGLIFADIRMMSGRLQDAIPSLFGADILLACLEPIRTLIAMAP